ncbi:hypothetical protein EJB05_35609, partial [Eragrostis curvula]
MKRRVPLQLVAKPLGRSICRAVSGRVSREEEEARSELCLPGADGGAGSSRGWVLRGDYFKALAWADDVLSGAGAPPWKNFCVWDVLLEKAEKPDGFELSRDTIIKALLADMFAAETHTFFIVLKWAVSELVKNPTAMRGALR